ncbi:MAG: ribonuclease P protein component [Myxococcota bacterium]|nr:ribonuclease P protein component [Myxococcota bacterium]
MAPGAEDSPGRIGGWLPIAQAARPARGRAVEPPRGGARGIPERARSSCPARGIHRNRREPQAARTGARVSWGAGRGIPGDVEDAVAVAGPGIAPERPRLGLTVSRRVGREVARNRVNRRVREWFRRPGSGGSVVRVPLHHRADRLDRDAERVGGLAQGWPMASSRAASTRRA